MEKKLLFDNVFIRNKLKQTEPTWQFWYIGLMSGNIYNQILLTGKLYAQNAEEALCNLIDEEANQ